MPKNIYDTYVPNEIIKGSKILWVGESPGEVEEDHLKPFVGPAGKQLRQIIGRHFFGKSSFANLSNYRPLGNRFELLLGSEQLRAGLAELKRVIDTNEFNVIVALGGWPLKFLTGCGPISAFRGSILEGTAPLANGKKVVASFHPAALFRDPKKLPIFDVDIKRAAVESNYPEIRRRSRHFTIDPRGPELDQAVEEITSAEANAIDIEGVKKSTRILCIGFATSPERAYCFPTHTDNHYQRAIAHILSSKVPKVFHFGNYDTTMLRANGYEVQNYQHDTLVGQHVLWPELPRSLAFLTSIYTNKPYYKSTGRDEIPGDDKAWSAKSRVDKNKLYEYNCDDCVATYEIYTEQVRELMEMGQNYVDLFNFEMAELVELVPHIGDSGMLVDVERRKEFRQSLINKWADLQIPLNLIVGEEVNVRSPKLSILLYDKLGLPVRRIRGKAGEDSKVTTNEDALVATVTHIKNKIAELRAANAIQEWEYKLLVVKAIMVIRGLRQLLANYIATPLAPDGRLHSIYKIANTETGRWAAEKWIDGTGFNPQTFPRDAIEVPDVEAVGEELEIRARTLENQLIQDVNENEEIETAEYDSSAA